MRSCDIAANGLWSSGYADGDNCNMELKIVIEQQRA